MMKKHTKILPASFTRMAFHFFDLVEAIVGLLSFGKYNPPIGLWWRGVQMKKEIKKVIVKKKQQRLASIAEVEAGSTRRYKTG